jgi:hypothetical protein
MTTPVAARIQADAPALGRLNAARFAPMPGGFALGCFASQNPVLGVKRMEHTLGLHDPCIRIGFVTEVRDDAKLLAGWGHLNTEEMPFLSDHAIYGLWHTE